MATPAHPTGQTLEQLAEGTLPLAEATEASAHVESCAQCSAELDALTSLYSALGSLPRYAPSAAFADGVMARVHVAARQSWAMSWLRRLAPNSRRGWALISVAVTAPSLPLFAIVVWLLSQPLLSPTTLWQWGLMRVQAFTQAGLAWLFGQPFDIGAMGMAESLYSTLQTVPESALGGGVALLAIAIPLSAWGLIRLTRTPKGSVTYAK